MGYLNNDPAFYYINVSKTGSRAFTKALAKAFPRGRVHTSLIPVPDPEKLYSFAIVRNPYERMVSLWKGTSRHGRHPLDRPGVSYREIKYKVSHDCWSRGFDDTFEGFMAMMCLWQAKCPPMYRIPCKRRPWCHRMRAPRIWWHHELPLTQKEHMAGFASPDIYHYEDGLENILRHVDPDTEIPECLVLKRENASGNEDWEDHLTPRAIQLVHDFCMEDFDYGYPTK